MSAVRLEVADIFNRYGDAYRQDHVGSLSTLQRRVMSAIELCRTAALGGHVEQCDACGHQRIAYNNCRNRHCPKCQSLARAQWLEDRQGELLPVPYFHVVFTVPQEIAAITLQNKRVLYDILFHASAETLHTIAADPKHLGAETGCISILHSWGQNLLFHPHIHCVVPGGGLSPDGSRWIGCHPNFFLPVRVLSRLFRRLFLVVYAKPPFGGPKQVLDYLGRYTHRVAISNNRLLDIDDGKIRFRWKDYRHGSAKGVMTLDADEFIRRFLLHVVPTGFMRIRHYGFLANRHCEAKLACCRRLLGAPGPIAPIPVALAEDSPVGGQNYRDRYEQLTGDSLRMCPHCKTGHMVCIDVFSPAALPRAPPKLGERDAGTH